MDSNVVTIAACGVPPVTPIPPTLGKDFSPATINAGDTSTLTITLSNADATVASLSSPLIDTLPVGVLIAGSASTTCGGTATTGTSSVTLTGGSIPAHGSCTVTVPVTSTIGGNHINSLAVGALQTSNGSNAAPAVATLTVNTPAVVPPTLGKAFNPATINAGGTSTLTITLSNADATIASSASLTDTLPVGVLIAGSASTTCGGTATTGTSSVTLTGGSIPAHGSCTVTVLVKAASGGNYINSLAVGALQTSNGSNAAPAVATLTVLQPSTAPTLGKAFNPATINPGGFSILTITLSNTSGTAASSASLTDTLPGGVDIFGIASTTCGGTPSVGTGTVTLTGGSIPANGSCTVTVTVTALGGGSYINSLAAGALTTSNGSNAAPAIATLTVSTPSTVTLGKVFVPSTINVGDISKITITLSNTGDFDAIMTAPLIDLLPSGLVITGGFGWDCGGTLDFDSTSVTLTGGTIPAHGSCTIGGGIPVTASVAGSYFNTLLAGALQTSNGSNAAPVVATLTVLPVVPASIAPKLSKSFSPATIKTGGVSTLTITLSNPDSSVAKLTALLTDNLPGGVVVAKPANANTNCGGALTAAPGSSKVILKGGSIPANGSCKVTVDVTAEFEICYKANKGNNAATAVAINTLPAGALKTSNGSNAAKAVATLTVIRASIAPKLSKSFSPATIKTGGVSTLTITLNNPNGTVAKLTAPLTDNLPSGVVVYGKASTTCGGTLMAYKGGSKVILTGGSIPANGSCAVTVNVTAEYEGTCYNKLPAGALQTDQGNNASQAVATLTVVKTKYVG